MLLLLPLSACGAPTDAAHAEEPAASTSPAPTSTEDATSSPNTDTEVDFLVVGDSLTAGSQAIVDGTRPGDGSWVDAADRAPAHFDGGWAVPGATTAAMVAGVAGVRADGEDLVVLGGTNDAARGVAPSETLINIETIVATVGSDDVLLVAIPPLDLAPALASDLNTGLSDLAATRGWGFTDPWLDVRDGGHWTTGASLDGIHPTQDVADVVGTRIRSWLVSDGG